MKMKRWISILLTLALCLGLLPGAALATEEGTESSLPEGYEQMYVEDNDSYVTVAEIEAGNGTDIQFYVKNSDEYTALNSTVKPDGSNAYVYATSGLTVTCSDSKLGETGVGLNGTNWRAGNAVPGATGFIYAVNGENKYAIEAKVGAPLVGVYTQTPDKDKPAEGYVAKTNGHYQINYDPSVESTVVYICTGLNTETSDWTFSAPTSSNNDVSVALSTNSKTLTVTLGASQTGTVETTISVNVNGNINSYDLVFKNSTALTNEKGYPLSIHNELGGRRTFQLYYGDTPTLVPSDATVTLSDSSFGTISAAEDIATSGNWVWIAGSTLPTTQNGKLNVTVKGKTYSADVSVGLPDNGFYTSHAVLSEETYLPNGFSYDGTNNTFYLVWNNSHSYIPANSAVSINYRNGDQSGLVSAELVETGETFNGTEAKRCAIKFTVANTVSDDFSFEVNFGLINRDGGTETNNWGIRVIDNTPKLMYRYMSWDKGQPYEDVSRSLRPASELSISYGNTETVKFYYGTEGSYVAASEVTAPTNSCIKVTPGTTTDGKSTTYWELKGTDLGTSTLSVTGGTEGNSFTVTPLWTVDLPLIGIYSGTTASKDAYCSNVEYTGNDIVLYILPNSSDVTVTSVTANGGPASDYTTVKDNIVTISSELTGSCNLSYKVFYTIGNSTNDVYIDFAFTGRNQEDSGNQSGSGGNQDSRPSVIAESHRLEDDEIYKYEGNLNEHMGAFTLDGDPNTYYMVPGNRNSPYPYLNGDSTSYEAQMRLMYIEFWVGLGQDNYSRVTDSATLNKIKAAFSDTNGNCTLTMDLKATVYYQSPLPTDYPAIYTTPDVDAWRQPITAKFDFGSAGTWLYCASGKIGDQTITSLVRSKIGFGGDIIWTPDTGTEVDVITQVNTYLNTVELPDNFGLIVNLPAGNYSGYITVPSRLSDDGISINGVYDETNGVFSTILNGGVQGENRRTHVTGIHFIGAGENVKEWDKNTVNSGRPNYAYYGSCGGNFGECLFENYDCAVMSSCEIKTGTNSWFKNNHTAVCYNTIEFAGIGASLEDNLYEDNEIAIHFAQFSDRVGLTILGISGSCFVDNKTDIRNDLKRNIYVPGNYFAYTDNGIEKTRECKYLPQANGNKDKIVHYYPQSANRQFNAWIYDMSFYKHDPVVSANLAATYKIPAEYLTKSVTVMNEDETLAVWTFGKKEEE